MAIKPDAISVFRREFRALARGFSLGSCLVMTSLFFAHPAIADDGPGTPNAASQELSEVTTDQQLGGVNFTLRSMRADDGGAVFAGGTQGPALSLGTRGGLTDPGLTAGTIQYRDLHTDDINGSLVTGSATLGYRVDQNLIVFGALLGERTDVDTDSNDGTLEGSGIGLALGVDYLTPSDWALTATVGGMQLDYDMSRSGGAVTGSFESERWFADVRGERQGFIGGNEGRFALGLRHVEQTDDGYTESGGAVVPESSSSFTVGYVEGQVYLPDVGDGFRPFVEGDARLLQSSSDDLPASVSLEGEDSFLSGIGVGVARSSGNMDFEVGAGANFDRDGYSGVDARLNLALRF